MKEWEQIIANKQRIAEKYISACKYLGINYISQNEFCHSGIYYKFILYNIKTPIQNLLSKFKTITSPIIIILLVLTIY